MAAAIVVPLVTELVPLVIPLFVRLADKIFGTGNGSHKLDFVTTIAQSLNQGLIAAGAIDKKDSKTIDQIHQIVESVVAGLNASGELQGANTAVTLPPVVAQAIPQATVINLVIDAHSSVTGLAAFLDALKAGLVPVPVVVAKI